MALTTCAECGGQVSDQAAACPHCGAPVRVPTPTVAAPTVVATAKKRTGWGTIFPVILGIIVVIVVLASVLASQTSPTSYTTAPSVLSPTPYQTPKPTCAYAKQASTLSGMLVTALKGDEPGKQIKIVANAWDSTPVAQSGDTLHSDMDNLIVAAYAYSQVMTESNGAIMLTYMDKVVADVKGLRASYGCTE